MRYSDLTIHLANVSLTVRAEASKNLLRKEKLRFRDSGKKQRHAFFTEKYPPFSGIQAEGFDLKVDNKLWKMQERGGVRIITIKPTPSHQKIVAVLNSKMDRGKIYLWDPKDEWLHTRLGKIIFDRLLSSSRAFVFHASSVSDGPEGYIFLGRSGAGKSTISRLWHEKKAQVIHDDRVIVRRCKSGFLMCSTEIFKRKTPGIYSGKRTAMLKRMFVLKHGATNRLNPLTRTELFKAMFKESISLAWDKDALRDMFHFHLDLADSIPWHELEFVPHGTCVDFLRSRFSNRKS